MRRFLVLVLLAALARSDDQGRQFPPGVIVDPQYYDQPNYDEGPLERPPHFGGRPPHGDRPPYYGDNPYGGQPPYEQNNDQKQGYQPKPYRPTAPPVHRPGPPPQGYGPYPPPGYNEPGYRPGPPSQGYGPYPPAGYNEPGFGGGFNPMGSFSNALESLAKYDEKQCVARMLCELSAGGRPGSGYYRGSGGYFDFSGLQGVVDLLGAMTASQAGSSPMLTFGRAALLGATMRDPYRCYRSFPNCPRDPDRLVDYLNNHNGGFFRLFEPTPTAPPSSSYTKRPYYYNRKGKKLDEAEHKEQRESEQGESSNLVNPRIINDAPPLIGEQSPNTRLTRGPKAIRHDYQQSYSPTRLNLQIPNPVRVAKKPNFFPEASVNRTAVRLPPSVFNLIRDTPQKTTPANYQYQVRTTTPRPQVHHHFHDYDDYHDETNPDFADDYPIDDKVEPLKGYDDAKDTQHPDYSPDYPIGHRAGPLVAKAPTPQVNRELMDVYRRPSRVLYAGSSRPDNNRNQKSISQSSFRFPAQFRQ